MLKFIVTVSYVKPNEWAPVSRDLMLHATDAFHAVELAREQIPLSVRAFKLEARTA